MHLLDEVRLGRFQVWPSVVQTWTRLQDFASLNDTVPVDIRNIYGWFKEEWESGGYESTEKRRRFWMEAADLRPSFDSAWFEWNLNQINTHYGRQTKVDRRVIWALDAPNFMPGWTMVLFERQDGDVVLTHIWALDSGSTNESNIGLVFPADDFVEGDERGFLCGVMMPVILAQNLMHCKNVVIEAEPTPPKLARNFQRKHKLKPAAWRAVRIEPMKRVLQGCGSVRGLGVAKALHVVRGNFAEYTEEKPLFGKVVGRFFRPMHLRGNSAVGVKKPGYCVEPPNRAA